MSQPPKRVVTLSAKEKVQADGLKLGMFVEELDCPWENTPFLIQGFHLKTDADIKAVQKICKFVYVSTQKSLIVTYDNIGGLPAGVSKSAAGKSLDPDLATSLQTINATSPSAFRPTVPARFELDRANKLTNQGRDLAKSFLNRAREGKKIDTSEVEKSVSQCMNSIMTNPDAMLWLSKIRNEDEYTSQHSFNVCILALIFGRHLGIEGEALANLGICGMLHDVGKMNIPVDVLNKEGMLTPDEFNLIKTHTTHGRNILRDNENMVPNAIEVAYGHHETIDGSGYPRGVASNTLSELCRIVQVCDVYDAVTSLRVYKKAETSASALKILYDNRGTKFDKYFVEEFIACIGLYPPGSVVELTSGEIAIVVATNYDNRRLPKVAVVCDENKQLCQIKTINLAKIPKGEESPRLLIKTALPNGSFGVRLEEYVKNGLKVG